MDDDCVMLARVVEEPDDGETLLIRLFVSTQTAVNGQEIFDYEEAITEVSKESVCGRYDAAADERVAGYDRVGSSGFVRVDDDDDYEPVSEDSSSDDDDFTDEEEEEEDL